MCAIEQATKYVVTGLVFNENAYLMAARGQLLCINGNDTVTTREVVRRHQKGDSHESVSAEQSKP